MPTNLTPLPFHASYSRSHTGASWLQVGHHGAQNSKMTGDPLRSSRLKDWPSSNSSVNPGAGCAAPCARATSSPASAAIAIAAVARRISGPRPRRE